MDLAPRKLTEHDYDDIVRVWQQSGLSYRPTGRDTRERIAGEMRRSDTGYLGLDIDGRLVAVVVATYDGRKGWINRLAVEPEHRRKGMGLALIDAALRFLKSQGALVTAALIEDWNESSVALFRRYGFHLHSDIHYLSIRDDPDS